MNECRHLNMIVLNNSSKRLRCRFCHLTLKPDELSQGYCPECFEESGKKRDAFEEILLPGEGKNNYRCEDCGQMLSPLNA